VISIQIDIDAHQVENALVDLGSGTRDGVRFIDLVVWSAERIGDPALVKDLIGKLGDTYTYLEGTFGDGTE